MYVHGVTRNRGHTIVFTPLYLHSFLSYHMLHPFPLVIFYMYMVTQAYVLY